MEWDWLIERYPEIAHLSQREQNEIVRVARRSLLGDIRHWAPALVAMLLPLAAIVISTRFVSSSGRITVLAVLAWFALLTGAHVLAIRYRYRVMRRTIRDDLLRRGVHPARCFECGYDLRAAEAARCPECGVPFVHAGP